MHALKQFQFVPNYVNQEFIALTINIHNKGLVTSSKWHKDFVAAL